MSCAKCGFDNQFQFIYSTQVWLCERCYNKWANLINRKSKKEQWRSEFSENWNKEWDKWIGDAIERVIFT